MLTSVIHIIQDRAHRIGQTRQVRVFKMITENTIARIEPMKETIMLLKKHFVHMKPD